MSTQSDHDLDAKGRKRMSPAEVDKIICEWSIEMSVPLTEEQLNELVDRLSRRFGLTQ